MRVETDESKDEKKELKLVQLQRYKLNRILIQQAFVLIKSRFLFQSS